MARKGQQSGMRGVFLAAAELARRDFIVSPTARNAAGADLLVTNQGCSVAYSVQVKTNTAAFDWWVVGAPNKQPRAESHVYVLVNIRAEPSQTEFFVVPSKFVADHTRRVGKATPAWFGIDLRNVQQFRDRWDILGKPKSTLVA
ncbi:MAG: hypothetical protein KGL02_06125 [Acidobacteriota bacterium]|nr:hypothetical protein [Acidobacteriota bacterium]